MVADFFGWQETAFEKMTGLPRRTADFLRNFRDAPEQVVSKRVTARDTLDWMLSSHSFVSIVSQSCTYDFVVRTMARSEVQV
jgi:hypothetical protein